MSITTVAGTLGRTQDANGYYLSFGRDAFWKSALYER